MNRQDFAYAPLTNDDLSALFSMSCAMAIKAKGNTVRRFKAKSGMCRPRLHVVRIQSAAAYAAILTGVIVAGKNGSSPQRILFTTAFTLILSSLSTLPTIAFLSHMRAGATAHRRLLLRCAAPTVLVALAGHSCISLDYPMGRL